MYGAVCFGRKIRAKSGAIIDTSEYIIMDLTFIREGKVLNIPVKDIKDFEYKKYNGEDLTQKSVLIWRQGGIGDILFIGPLIRELKKNTNVKLE